MKKLSLKRRLVFAVVLSQLLLALGLVVVASWLAHYYLQSAFDVYLEGRALTVGALVYYPDDGSPGLRFDVSKIPRSPHEIHKDLYLVRSDIGNFERHASLYESGLFDRIPAAAHFWDFEFDGEPYRAIILRDFAILDTEASIPQPFPKLTVIYAAPTMDIGQRITTLASAIGVTGVVLVLPTILLAVWNIRRALAPLHDLAARAKSISVHNWEFQPSEEAKAAVELQPLIGAIETVLSGLQRAFTQQREFLGDAAHELKTSLAIVKSTLQSLLNRPRDAEEYRHGLEHMNEDSERLEELLSRMLRLARVEQWAADGIHRDLDLVDVASTCEMAIARISELAKARDICIYFNVSQDLNTSQMVLMRADPADLELVWLNLLENAVKYSAPGSQVNVSLAATTQSAEISVSDSGIGIAESELGRIFERFRRGDPSRSRATGGFGLGLAIAKSVVEAYKGSIHAESRLGGGTRISVILPTWRPSNPKRNASVKAASGVPVTPSH
jgi:signal transduction histidine kinase